MKISASLLTGVVITGIAIVSPGCSPSDWSTRELPSGSNFQPGEKVTIMEKNGTIVVGEYQGMVITPLAEYSREYAAGIQMNGDGRMLPAMGQRIEVTTALSESKSWSGQFLGFDDQSLWLKCDGDDDPREFYISTLTSFTGRDSKIIRGMMFRNLYLNGDVPLMSAFVLKNNALVIQVSLDNVQTITIAAREDSHASDGVSMKGAALRGDLMR